MASDSTAMHVRHAFGRSRGQNRYPISPQLRGLEAATRIRLVVDKFSAVAKGRTILGR